MLFHCTYIHTIGGTHTRTKDYKGYNGSPTEGAGEGATGLGAASGTAPGGTAAGKDLHY